MELSKIQKEIATTTASKVVVVSAAASGKTATITARAKWLLDNGEDPRGIVLLTFTNAAAEEMADRLGHPVGLFIGTIHSYANRLLLTYGIDTSDIISNEQFNKLFSKLKKHPECLRPVNHLILDESQDSNPEQFEFILDMVQPKNFMFVGDHRQCQPAGTKILLRGGEEKDISNILVGDDLVYYDNPNGRCSGIKATTHNAVHKRVEKISSRKLNNEKIIEIKTAEGQLSKYTEGHRTFVRINANTKYQHAVYLMCDENYRFRIGKIPFRGTQSQNGNPWRAKTVAEGCKKIWLLKLFETDKEARIYEQKMSYLYQIPQTCWQIDKVQWTKEDIDYIYEGINTYENAKKCLIANDRNILYPIIDLDVDWSKNQKFASNATCQIYACNIIPEAMDAVVYDPFMPNNHSNKRFTNIISRSDSISNEIVYSLQVEGGTYIADGLATHNSIYRWNGSYPDFLLELMRRPDVTTYEMDENYRNASKILDFARGIITTAGYDYRDESIAMRDVRGRLVDVVYNPKAIAKTVKEMGNYGSWFILTRTNEQIETMSRELAAVGVPYDTFKRSQFDNKELNEVMKRDTVKVLTIHSSKGLEADNVIVIGAKFYNIEERCVSYVAATRARNLLVWARLPNKREKLPNMDLWET